MRTNQLCDFETKTSEINNHLSHTVFVFKQFSIDNSVKAANQPDDLTTTVYTANEYARQFNVKLKDISEQADKSLGYILDTLFVFTNTQFEVYLKEVYLFAKQNSQLKLAEPPESQVYETILERIGIDQEKEIDNLFVSTYEYFRYRRNAIMHRDKDRRLQGALDDLIRGKNPNGIFRKAQYNGTELNLNWKRYTKSLDDAKTKGYTIRTFDFANKDVSKFSLTDLFDIFNFYRLYAAIIDKLVLGKIERKYLLNYLVKRHQENYGGKKEETIQSFTSRFQRTNKLELNLTLTNEETEKIFNNGI
jgi:hypothetical protein